MIKTFFILLFILLCLPLISIADTPYNNILFGDTYVPSQASLDANNIQAFIWDSGIFDQDLRTNNTPGFIWPKGTTHTAIFSAGLTISGYVNNQIRLATASYRGEYRPGYCVNGVFFTNPNFKLYKVTRGDNSINNPDWANWGLMVPYGAPFEDINNNGIYEPLIDKAGVKGSAQTIFVSLTDADPSTHTSSEGFGGGTTPLGVESHLTVWCYDNPGYGDMQFLKWIVINKNNLAWDSVSYSITSDPDLGDAIDDYIGCDTIRNLGYCYNSDDQDGDGTGRSYGLHPPAVGFQFLNCNNPNLQLQSFNYIGSTLACERDPSSPLQAYNLLHGFKNDRSPWMNPFTLTSTFYCYSGDPNIPPGSSNWTEFGGSVQNCGGPNGTILTINPAGDRHLTMNYQNTNHRMNPGDTQVVQICQLIARGSNNLNSVTLLKQLADVAKNLCENNFIIGIQPISTEIPKTFSLSQNYPNPFNPTSKIKFNIPLLSGVAESRGVSMQLKIYDIIGKEVVTLVNESLKPGSYEVEWNAANYPSGIYFYKLVAEGFMDVKKMVLVK